MGRAGRNMWRLFLVDSIIIGAAGGRVNIFIQFQPSFGPFLPFVLDQFGKTLAHSECHPSLSGPQHYFTIQISECSPISQSQQCNMSWNVLQAHFLLFSSSPPLELPPPLELSLLASRLCNSPREPVSEGRRREGATFFS